MKQEDQQLLGQRIELQFDPPRKAGALADQLKKLIAQDQVELRRGQDQLVCQQLEVQLGPDQTGRNVPTTAQASGPVEVRQQQRLIKASKQMIVGFGSFEIERPLWNPIKARAEAVRRGHDPDTIDWAKQKAHYEAQPRYQPGLTRLEAFGNVAVRDPKQGLQVDGDYVEVRLAKGQQLASAHILGTKQMPASVKVDDFSIAAAELLLNADTERVEAPGAGQLTFRSAWDLDGDRTNSSVPVTVTWQDRMTYRGTQNRAWFVGQVKAASSESVFTADELMVDFADRPKTKEQPLADGSSMQLAAAGQAKWWIFTPLTEQLNDQKKKPASPLVGPQFDKEPIAVLATGQATIETTRKDPNNDRVLSRGHLHSPKVLVDLRREVLTIEAGGGLLIEDYQLPKKLQGNEPGLSSPFGGLASPVRRKRTSPGRGR